MKLGSIELALAPPITFAPVIEKPLNVFDPRMQPPCDVSVATVTNELRQSGIAKLMEDSAIIPTTRIRDLFRILVDILTGPSDCMLPAPGSSARPARPFYSA